MNAISRERFLHVTEHDTSASDLVAVLGREIRTAEDIIAQYCITQHLPVYEDLAVLVESMAYMDRIVTRHRSREWSRELTIQVPVYEIGVFTRAEVVDSITEAAWFLTGDDWNFKFVPRKDLFRATQSKLPLNQSKTAHVVPFSDGLDSFAQARFSVAEYGRDAVLLVRAGLGKHKILPDLTSLRVPRKFSGIRLREISYRTRPLIFYTFAGIAADMTKATAIVIGENGQGSFGSACLPFADEWWFRSTHPAFIARWANVLGQILGRPTLFEQPNLWKTKGEVLAELQDRNLSAGWEATTSCSTRPAERYGRKACGICGGCVLRIVSALSAGYALPGSEFAFDIRAKNDKVCDRNGTLKDMPSSHRKVAVRAVAAMHAFARLLDSPRGEETIRREARLVNSKNSKQVEEPLIRLLKRHRSEWDNFVSSLQSGYWLREIVEQL
jgi:hypothetical protein